MRRTHTIVGKAASLALVLVMLSTGVRLAHAQGDRMKEVKRACAAGEVDKAVRLLADLYAETNDPIAIYNQARCYQQNAQPELAASRFREYLRKAPNLPQADRAEVDGFIREADAEAARRAPAAAPPGYTAATPPGYPAAPPAGYPSGYTAPGTYPPQPTSYPPSTYPAGYPAGQAAASAPAYATPAPPVAAVAGKSEPVRRKKGLLIAGTITLGASYLLTALVGAAFINTDPKVTDTSMTCGNKCGRVGGLFLIPVLGPWLAIPVAPSELKGGAAVFGVAQAVGLTLTIIGYRGYAASKPRPPGPLGVGDLHLGFLPTSGGGVGALRARF